MSLSKISRHRNEIMGVSMLCVMLFHSEIYFPIALWPATFIKTISYGAVDLFFFLSGFGLFHSWSSRKLSTVEFYKVRLLRVLPSYWLIVIIYFFIIFFYSGEFSFLDFFFMMTGVNFYLHGDLFFWFIPSIICCYLLFPLIVSFISFDNNNRNIIKNVILAIGSTLLLSLVITTTDFHYLLILTLRLPIFILGIYAGYLFIQRFNVFWLENIKLNVVILLLGILLLGLVIIFTTPAIRWQFGLWWYPFIIIAYPLCLLLALSFQCMEDYRTNISIFKIMRKFVSFCGRYSLEIYLIHVVIFKILPVFVKKILPVVIDHKFNIGRIPEYSIYALLAICLSPLLSKLTSPFRMPNLVAKQNVPAHG